MDLRVSVTAFLFQDDDSVLIHNMVNANRFRHVSHRPQVALHFDGDGTGGDIEPEMCHCGVRVVDHEAAGATATRGRMDL